MPSKVKNEVTALLKSLFANWGCISLAPTGLPAGKSEKPDPQG